MHIHVRKTISECPDTAVKSSMFKCVRVMRAVRSMVMSSYAMLVASFSLAREQLTLYTISGSVWPPDSLFNKFRRLCHRNEARYSVPVDTAVSLKASLAKSGHNLRMK